MKVVLIIEVILLRQEHENIYVKKHGGKGKGGLNQGPSDTASIYNQFASEILHSVLNLLNLNL